MNRFLSLMAFAAPGYAYLKHPDNAELLSLGLGIQFMMMTLAIATNE